MEPASAVPHLFVDGNGDNNLDAKFAVVPSNNIMYFDDGRSNYEANRGPCKSLSRSSFGYCSTTCFTGSSIGGHVTASAHREAICIQNASHFRRAQGMHYGPRQYQPAAKKKLAVLHDDLKVISINEEQETAKKLRSLQSLYKLY